MKGGIFLTKIEKYIDATLITIFAVILVIGFTKGYFQAFENLPERMAFFMANFGK